MLDTLLKLAAGAVNPVAVLAPLVAGPLMKSNDPTLQAAGQGLNAIQGKLKAGEGLSSKDQKDLMMAEINERRDEIRAATDMYEQQQLTHREAIRSEDPYVRRARPTLIYIFGICLLVLFFSAMLTILFTFLSPERGKTLIEAWQAMDAWIMVVIGSLSPVVAAGVVKRSHDKQVAQGMQPVGMFSGIASSIANRGGANAAK